MDKLSYALGLSIGNNFRASGISKIDLSSFGEGIRHVMDGTQPEMTYDEAKQIINEYLTRLQAEKMELNKKAGEEFLAINKEKAGVVTTASGLQYQILTKGDGAIPKATDTIRCHYHGTLIDGTVFDSSVQRGEPISFGVGQVIKGWTEALQLMPVGSKWRLFIPSELAYGSQGAGASIEPNSTLIFDVELLGIE